MVNWVVQSVSDLGADSDRKAGLDDGRAPDGEALALTGAQLGIWFAQKLNPASPAYNIGEYIEIEGAIDTALFERALARLVAEADVLRVRFVEVSGEPRQIVGADRAFSLPVIDVSGESDPRAAAQAWMQADMAKAVDPVHGPLFQFALFRISAGRFFWYARYHHLIADGYGMWLLARRAAAIYTRLARGEDVREDTLGPYTALLEDDAAYRASELAAKDRHHWLRALSDLPEPGSLTFSERPPVHSPNFLRATVDLAEEQVAALSAAARRAGTDLTRLLIAAAAILLHRLKMTDDVVIGVPVAARTEATRNVAGMTSNVLPLSLSLRPGLSVADVVAQTALRLREILQHQRCPLAELRQMARSSGEARPLFGLSVNAMRFDYDFAFGGCRATAHNLSLGPVEDLSISVYRRMDAGPLRIDIDVNPALHTNSDLAFYKQRFLNLLAGLAGSDAAIGNLDLLEAAERKTVLRTWNETDPVALLAPHAATFPALFAAQAARTPYATAVVFEDREFSYAALDADSNRLANHLRSLGVGPETVVGLCVERSPEMVIGLLGILKAGAAYLPLDPQPPARAACFHDVGRGRAGAGDRGRG